MKILLRNLTKRFPDRNKKTRGEITAVNDLTLEIPDGKLVGLLGPSGCGKSTTLNLICGLEKATEGTIFFGDRDVTALEPEHRGVIFGYAQAVRSSCSGLGHLGACIIAPALGVNALYWTIPAAFLALAAMVALFRNRIAQRIRCVQSNYITSSGASS